MELIEYFVAILSYLFFLSSMVLSAGGAGYVLLRKQRFYSFLEKLIFSIALGLGVWALLLFILGLLGWLYRDWIWNLTLICSIVVILSILRSINLPLEMQRLRSSYKPHFGQIVYIVAILYLGILLSVTLYPPVYWDSNMYHLVLAKQNLADNAITVNTGIIFPVLPLLNHMLFTWALAIKGHLLAQMIECTLLILIAIGLYSWGTRQNQPAFGLAIASFWLAHPLVLWLGRSAFVDIGLAAYLFLGIYALRIFWDHSESQWWYIAIALLGFGSAVKMIGLLFLALGAAVGFYAFLRSKVSWKTLAYGYVLGFLLVVPWYAFIAYHTGNPFWPLFYQYSRGIWSSSSISSTFGWIFSVGIPKTIENFILLPYYMALHPNLFPLPDENMTLFLPIIIWPLAWIVAFFSPSVRWWVLWALFYSAFWFLSSQQLRFWIVVLPIVGLALFESIKWLIERFIVNQAIQRAIWLTLASVAFVFSAHTTFSLIYAWGYPSVTEERQQQFLKNGFVGYEAVEYINKKSGKNDVVYVINGSKLNYYLQPKIIDMHRILQGSIRPEFHWPEDKKWLEYLKSQKVTWLLVNHVAIPPGLKVKTGPHTNYPCWPDYTPVYADNHFWVFHYSPSMIGFKSDLCDAQISK